MWNYTDGYGRTRTGTEGGSGRTNRTYKTYRTGEWGVINLKFEI